MGKITKIWQSFLTRPDHWLFYAFLLSAPLSIRKIIFFYPLNGGFNEYAGIYIYLSDILLILTLISWLLVLLYNNIPCLSNSILSENSIIKCSTWNISIFKSPKIKLFLKRLTNKIGAQVIHRQILYTFLPFLLIAFFSIFWANLKFLALYKEIKLIEFFLLFVYLLINVPRGTFFKNILWITIFSGTINSIIGVIQFITQKSVGLAFLKESYLGSDIPGVAKVIFGGEKYIRAYGLFPHPNILGGFLLLSIIATYLFFKLFHVEQFKETTRIKCSTWNNRICESFRALNQAGSDRLPFILKLVMGIQTLALFLTFSKSAIFGLIIAIVYIKSTSSMPSGKHPSLKYNVPRGTFV